jgi:uncharacterized protein CbrC (UPF0167 family)
MTWPFTRRTTIWLLLAISVPMVLVGACLSARVFKQRQHQADLNAIAEQLGYTSQHELVRGEKCWDVEFFWLAHCGEFVHYTTDMSVEEFDQTISKLHPTNRLHAGADGYALFTDINMHTNKTLTLNGRSMGF